mmetsp:Transcript_29188/g.78765  ORF Transcript_29188/g.78765 Transcript_29188/m.78765 type:complete len:125 (-) Transcript_29188:141-515(-)|eukprot:CAMPEP_0171216640 /NCGR_PEP_ID=MMETSP0790-20130122/32283_1 /TAXON_ID=2925 /ORGANISM="Alexandrium catenella, Strain OF101" /LENGTH=124 /DNA_ID=CAMNT_0011682423 /DNA_START=87 /DNA_END=461 /DNA_ORIENTATION=+
MGNACCSDGGEGTEVSKCTVEPVDTNPEPNREPEPSLMPCVKLLFVLPDGSEKLMDIKYKPLGVGFKKEKPLVAKSVRPGSVAEEMHIQPHWVLKEVDGENIYDYEQEKSMLVLQRAFANLPQK